MQCILISNANYACIDFIVSIPIALAQPSWRPLESLELYSSVLPWTVHH